MKSRILILSPIYPPEPYTSASMFAQLAKAYSELGYDVTVLTAFPNRPQGHIYEGYKRSLIAEEIIDNIHIVRLWTWFINGKRAFVSRLFELISYTLLAIAYLLFHSKYEVVIHVPWPGLSSYLLSLVHKYKKSSYFYYIQDFLPEQAENIGLIRRDSLLSKILLWFDQEACIRSAGVLVLSEGFKQHCINTRKIESERVFVLPIFVDTKKIFPVARINQWRLQNQYSDDDFIVLFSGTIGHVSGIEILDGIAEIMPMHTNVKFLCIGDGPKRSFVQTLSEQYSFVKWLPFQSEQDYVFALGSADLAFLPISAECGLGSVPSKMYAYMAASKPILSNAPPASENARLINMIGCGVLVSPDDPKAIVDKIMEIYEDRDMLDKMGGKGYRYIVEHYTINALFPELDQFIQRCARSAVSDA